MKLLQAALRYWRTLRYLKPQQAYARLWFSVRQPRMPAAEVSTPRRMEFGEWVQPVSHSVSMKGPRSFLFLNQEFILRAPDGWNAPGLARLWLYNLHYFNDLNAADAALREAWHRDLITQWIADNPVGRAPGWEPYPTSLRIVNWIKWLLAGHEAPAGFEASLATQVQWLKKRLEWHLLGNHLFANAKALVFAGLFFDSLESQQWLALGLKILQKELPEQVLRDDGNFERSTMYHAIFLEDLLDLINLSNALPYLPDPAVQGRWRETATGMLTWLDVMTHPDGQIALFNDAAFGIAPDPTALRAYALRLGVQLPKQQTAGLISALSLDESGYVRLSSNQAVALLDVAPVGPDYLPGHAHADTLSFELSVHGQRVVCNGGTSEYGTGPTRLRERGTAAHSTVVVDNQDSSEVWSGFRVARRAYPFDLAIRETPHRVEVSCAHDGYRRLPGKPVHRRMWAMETDRLNVADTVLPLGHRAVARYILHPSVQPSKCGENAWHLSLANGKSVHVEVSAGAAAIEPACYAPEFGKVLPTRCLAVALVDGQAQTQWMWD